MNRKDIILSALVIISWGIHIPIIKMGTSEISSLLLLSLRMLLTGVIFLPFAGRLTREQFKQLLIFALFFYIGNMGCLFVALKFLQSATVALLIQMQVPFAMIMGWLLYKEQIGMKTLIGLVISFLGLFMIFGSPDINHYGGVLLIVCCCLSWAFSSARMRYIKDINLPTMMSYSCLLSLPVIFGLSLIFESRQWLQLQEANWNKLGPVLAYQVVLMSLMTFFWKQLLSRNLVQYVTAFALIQPIAGIVAAHFLLRETLSTMSLIGGGLTLIGVAIIIFRKIQKVKEPNLTAS